MDAGYLVIDNVIQFVNVPANERWCDMRSQKQIEETEERIAIIMEGCKVSESQAKRMEYLQRLERENTKTVHNINQPGGVLPVRV